MPPYASLGSTTWSPGSSRRADHGVLGGEAGGEREAPLALLERREGALEGGPGGVGGAAVLVAAAQPADAVLLVGRRRVDGRDHRSGRRVGLVARVDRTRLEARLLAMLLGHPASVSTAHRWLRRAVCARLETSRTGGFGRERNAHRGCWTLCRDRTWPAEQKESPCPSSPATSPPSSSPTSCWPAAPSGPSRSPPATASSTRRSSPTRCPRATRSPIFGLGCFWGAEEIYWKTPGVWSTSVGYAGGTTPNPSYEEVCSGRTNHTEAVRVVFDPKVVSYADLVKTFFEVHDPTQGFRQGNDVGTQYRSAIYFTTPEQEQTARELTAVYGEELTSAASARSRPRSGRPARRRTTTPRTPTSSTSRRTRSATAATPTPE